MTVEEKKMGWEVARDVEAERASQWPPGQSFPGNRSGSLVIYAGLFILLFAGSGLAGRQPF